jgi:hypothetical protein
MAKLDWYDYVLLAVPVVLLGWLSYQSVQNHGYPNGVYIAIIWIGFGLAFIAAAVFSVLSVVLEHIWKIKAAEGVNKAGDGVRQWGEGQARRGEAEQARARQRTEADHRRYRRR